MKNESSGVKLTRTGLSDAVLEKMCSDSDRCDGHGVVKPVSLKGERQEIFGRIYDMPWERGRKEEE